MPRSSILVLFLGMAVSSTFADDWPQWRGPQRNGISAESGWLDRWPAEGPKLLWSAQVGIGFSSFAVAGGRLYTMGSADEADTVFCLDASTGRVVWSHRYPSMLDARNFEGGPTATPTVDGDRVFTLSRWGDVFCLDAASGKVVWSRNLQKEHEYPVPQWGFSGSPLILGELAIFNLGEAGLALEKATGKTAWKSATNEAGYSTPVPLRRGDAVVVLVSSGEAHVAVDPRTGKEAWRIPWVTEYGANIADPIVDGDRVFVTSGYQKGAALLRCGGKGDPELVWQSKVLRSQMNPPLLINGFLYGIDGQEGATTLLKCVELSSGAEKWSERLTRAGALTAADGKLIVLGGNGELLVAPATPEGFKPTARAKILEGKCWTVPVLSGGRLYARNAEGRVVCIDLKK